MNKILVLVAVSLAVAQAAVTPRIPTTPDFSILKCNKGALEGIPELISIFQQTTQLCTTSEDSDHLYQCFADHIGIMGRDGLPDTQQLEDLLKLIFSKTILEDLPGMKDSFMKCGHAFASSYNSLVEDEEVTAVENFFLCVANVVKEYGPEVPKVCEYEFKFNGQ